MSTMQNRPRLMLQLLLIFAAQCAHAAEDLSGKKLGRLFTTAEQRAQLDLLRQHPKLRSVLPVEGLVRLDGIVTPEHGRRSIWLNGRRVPEEAISAADTASVQLRGNDASGQRLRVGQTQRIVPLEAESPP
ncbi:hypothetical protein [Uliginosibacterium sediminicola]|uniref:Flagella basal body P-ring formation protein FlgA n=1 Tax=Uliginosibacterium sediminicola TaxID=2024550 RepID=A0ABU9YV41_9RHOO